MYRCAEWLHHSYRAVGCCQHPAACRNYVSVLIIRHIGQNCKTLSGELSYFHELVNFATLAAVTAYCPAKQNRAGKGVCFPPISCTLYRILHPLLHVAFL